MSNVIVFEQYNGTEGVLNGVFKRSTGFFTTSSAPMVIGVAKRSVGGFVSDNTGILQGVFRKTVARFSDVDGPMLVGVTKRAAGSFSDTDDTPSVAFLRGEFKRVRGNFVGEQHNVGYLNGVFRRARGLFTTSSAPMLIGTFKKPYGFFFGRADSVVQILISQSQGELFVSAEPGGNTISLFDLFELTDSISANFGFVIQEMIELSESLHMSGTRTMRIAQSVVVSSVFTIINRMVLEDTLALTDNLSAVLGILLALADMVMLDDNVTTRREALLAVALGLSIADRANVGDVVTFAQGMDLSTLIDARVHALVTLLEELDIADGLTMRLHAIMQAKDAVHLTDAITAARAARMGLLESVLIGGVFRFAGLDYQIYAMTTVGAATSEYRGWQFNSFCTIDGVTYGADDEGLHELDGDTDNGEAIDAFVRMGLSTLGTSLYKAVPAVYVGYNGAGQLLLKVITTKDRRSKKENWYKLNPVAKQSDNGSRFDPSKNLHSVYWDFEIGNIDGEYFELDFVKVWRMALNRRKNT